MWKYIIIFVVLSCFLNSARCYHVESISPRSFTYGYSPFWDDQTQSLYFVDLGLNYVGLSVIVDQCLFRYDYQQRILYAAGIEGGYSNPSFLFPVKCSQNQFVVSINRTLIIVEWDGISSMAKFIRNASSVQQDPIYDINSFDSGKVDPRGRLVAGLYRTDDCPGPSSLPNGSLYLFEKNRNIDVLIPNTKSTVGLAFNKKKRLFYFLDYCNNFISEYDWYPSTGYIQNQRIAYALPAYRNQNQNYFGNGLEIDSCGNLYVGLYNASTLLKFSPRSRSVKKLIHLPVETPTALTFGGPNLDVLFVMTATNILDFSKPPIPQPPQAPSPLRGQVFMITGLKAKGAAPGTRLANCL